MSNTVGLSTAGSGPEIGESSLAVANLLLSVVPTLRFLIAECKQQEASKSAELLRRNGTKHEEMERVTAALFIIERRVRNIRRLRQVGSFGNSLRSLANCVSSFADCKTSVNETTEVRHLSHLMPYFLLRHSTRKEFESAISTCRLSSV